MIKQTISIPYTEFSDLSQLETTDRELVESAILSANDAYAPYSGFHVGVAIRLENGEIVTGNNQENAAFPSGLCAERVALFSAGAQNKDVAPQSMAIVAIKDNEITENPVTPCGACRQVFIETEMRYSKPFSLVLVGKKKMCKFERATLLLPLSFNSIDI